MLLNINLVQDSARVSESLPHTPTSLILISGDVVCTTALHTVDAPAVRMAAKTVLS